MADDTRTDEVEKVDTITDESEPATMHDVTEGGLLGAVGGAIVGGLAGGPIGAVIGAVIGGVASAGAVDVIDRHDHDYETTADTAAADGVPAGLEDVPQDVVIPTILPDMLWPVPNAASAVMPEFYLDTPGAELAAMAFEDGVRLRAYYIYEQRGRVDGYDVQDWLQAEHELLHV